MRPLGTLVLCLLVSGVLSAQAPKKTWSEDERLIHDYVLTADKLQRFSKASKQLEALDKANPGVKKDDDSVSSAEKSIAESARAFEVKCPQCIPILRANGFTPKEFMTMTMTAMTAMMSAWSKEQGGEIADFVNPANVTFVQQHKAEIEAMSPEKKSDQAEAPQSEDSSE
jgi:hypothetical protein